MDETLDLKRLVNQYVWQVNDVDKGLTKLSQDASELAEAVRLQDDERQAVEANLARLRMLLSALQDERESLLRQHSEASFVNDSAELQRISRRRVTLDKELEEVKQTIRSSVTPSSDFGEHAASLQVRKLELKERLPSISMLPMHIEILPAFLKAVYDALRADSLRLSDKHKSIKVPSVYSSEQLERAKYPKGRPKKVDHGQQESKRLEREKKTRIKRINEGEKQRRRTDTPSHTGKPLRQYEGVGTLADSILVESQKA